MTHMPAAQDHISASTPYGATVVGGGVTVRFWAPTARRVHVAFGGVSGYVPADGDELVRDPDSGDWTGFFPAVEPGTKYRFYVEGTGDSGFKRDPRARELELYGYPDCDALVVDPAAYPWHDQDWTPPGYADLIVYQFHVGVYYAVDDQGRDRRPNRSAKLLDAIQRVPYWADLGITAVQPLPVVEFQGEWSLGYNGTDLFSPEMDYCVDPIDLDPYVKAVNDLLTAKGRDPIAAEDLEGQANQLRAFVDVCHVYGIAVIVDVVFNHAGGGLDPESLDYVDLPANPGPFNNAYFSADGWAGGRVFAFDRAEVRRYLIDNAAMFLDEYHVDGLRFDEVTVIDAKGGWGFCQEMTAALRARHPDAVQIAEYWGEWRWLAVTPAPGGMGFDLGYADGVRDAVRATLDAVSHSADTYADLGRLAAGLARPANLDHAWRAYNCLENHDLVLDMDDHRAPRIARMADGGNPRSWYARSRSRVAMGLLLTAPGVPMLFMGQEFLEDKLWSDSPQRADRMIWWEGVDGLDRHMADFLRCTTDLIAVRRSEPALRDDPISVFQVDESSRVIAFQRWVPGVGAEVVVVASFHETALYDYQLGFPRAGRWREIFNSDAYDYFPNPWVVGNGGSVEADGPAMHGFRQSARLTIPANALLVFAAPR
jgi:1,4-alpha-glucan branching enzyme